MVSFSSDFSEAINNRLHLTLGTSESSLREETQRARVPVSRSTLGDRSRQVILSPYEIVHRQVFAG